MDIPTFGKDLVDILANRSLGALRITQVRDPREVLGGRIFRPEPGPGIGTTIGALVVGVGIGAGVTALLTPVSGPELRKRVARSTRSAHQQLSTVSSSLAEQLERAGRAIERSVGGMTATTTRATTDEAAGTKTTTRKAAATKAATPKAATARSASTPPAAKRGGNGHADLNGAKNGARKGPARPADA